MLSRNDCVLKTSGNFKITSLVARYSLSSTRQPITSSLISPLGIVPLLPSLIITPRSYEACTQQSCTVYTITRISLHIFSILHFLPPAYCSQLTWHEAVCPCAPPDCCCHYAMWHRSRSRGRSWPRHPRPDLTQTGAGGQGPARGQWCDGDGITRLNNVRIMGLKPRLSMGSLGSHNCQTTGISAFSNPRSLAGPRPPSRWHLGILLHDKIEIGVDTPSSWNATNASPWISN